MKPFDLQKALAGEPVVCRNGTKVLEIVRLNKAAKGFEVVTVLDGVSGNNTQYYGLDGTVTSPYSSVREFDLFMAPVEKTVWVNLYPDIIEGYLGKRAAYHETQEKADYGSNRTRLGGKAHKITYTE